MFTYGQWPIAALLMLLLGCGANDSVERFHVSGTVIYKGEPLPFGEIIFEPDHSSGNSGPQGAALIEAGKYDTKLAGGKGMTGGLMRVVITGYRRRDTSESDVNPPIFSGHSEIREIPRKLSVQDFTVPGKPN